MLCPAFFPSYQYFSIRGSYLKYFPTEDKEVVRGAFDLREVLQCEMIAAGNSDSPRNSETNGDGGGVCFIKLTSQAANAKKPTGGDLIKGKAHKNNTTKQRLVTPLSASSSLPFLLCLLVFSCMFCAMQHVILPSHIVLKLEVESEAIAKQWVEAIESVPGAKKAHELQQEED